MDKLPKATKPSKELSLVGKKQLVKLNFKQNIFLGLKAHQNPKKIDVLRGKSPTKLVICATAQYF